MEIKRKLKLKNQVQSKKHNGKNSRSNSLEKDILWEILETQNDFATRSLEK